MKSFIEQFIDQYPTNTIEEDVVNFYNDAYMLIQEFKSLEVNNKAAKEAFLEFINYVLKHQELLKAHQDFDFNKISTWETFHTNNELASLSPIYTPYSFIEIEETIDQIVDEMKLEKQFRKELKSEVEYLLEEYKFHVDHLEENISYHFIRYEDFEGIELTPTFIESFRIEKRKFIQRTLDRTK